MSSRILASVGITVVLALLAGCAQQVATPKLAPAASLGHTNIQQDRDALPRFARPAVPQTPLSPAKSSLPQAGQLNALNLTVSPAMAEAYLAYAEGRGADALKALESASSETAADQSLARFHLSTMKAQTLIMMGRAADAEEELQSTARYEIAVFGTDVNARALSSEVQLWLGNYLGARRIALGVAAQIRDWVLPTSYGGPPSNLAELVALTTAQVRAYTILAGQYVLRGEADMALPWAEAAEYVYNNVHYVANHPLYGPFVPTYADSYYGRAFNLAFLGVAKGISSGNAADGQAYLRAANRYFEAIGYRAGKASTEALHAYLLWALKDFDAASEQAERAVAAASERGLADLVWRVEAIHADALWQDEEYERAEAAYRRADAAVDLVTGSLASDRAKRKYGIGKDTVTRHLVELDVRKGDTATLFKDLERGRARAFVDLLADQPVAPGRQTELVQPIKVINGELSALRTRMLSPRGDHSASKADESELLAKRAELLDQLRQRDPDLAAVYASDTASLKQVQSALPADARLAYALPGLTTNAPLRLLLVDRNQAEVISLKLNQRELRRQLDGFHTQVNRNNVQGMKDAIQALQSGIGFQRWKGQGRLYVVPTGPWFFMPWGALPASGETVVLPTGDWLLRTVAASGNKAAVLGDPQFGGELPQLPGARQEARELAELLHVTPLLGGEATPAALRGAVDTDTRVLHVATHALFDADQPLRSSLALSDGNGASYLTAADVFANPIAADIVVLSACETGMGEVIPGDDYLGLARSFYLAGAKSVLHSLWPVQDEGTREYMLAFHKALAAGDDSPTAWLKARDATRAAGYSPAVFGAFVLGGG
ncbi:MAG: CHAT domain-containing protein [Gammaproteobacteria bacterium]